MCVCVCVCLCVCLSVSVCVANPAHYPPHSLRCSTTLTSSQSSQLTTRAHPHTHTTLTQVLNDLNLLTIEPCAGPGALVGPLNSSPSPLYGECAVWVCVCVCVGPGALVGPLNSSPSPLYDECVVCVCVSDTHTMCVCVTHTHTHTHTHTPRIGMSFRWSQPRTSGPPPPPLGSVSLVSVGTRVYILFGCEGRIDEEALIERDTR